MILNAQEAMTAVVRAHSIGFLALDSSGRGLPSSSAGSGTLIEYLGIRGVLTAAHVADTLTSLRTVGIMRFRVGSTFEGMHCKGSDLEVTKIGGPNYPSEGPDLAFVRLPPQLEERIAAENAFFNSTVRARLEVQGVTRGNHQLTFVTGVVAEMSREVGRKGDSVQVEHATLTGTGQLIGPTFAESGIDNWKFLMSHNERFPPPGSYEGLSGGGLWQLNDAEGPVGRTLIGVVYYQGDRNEDGRRLLYCHGPLAVHDTLCQKVLDRYDPVLAKLFREADPNA